MRTGMKGCLRVALMGAALVALALAAAGPVGAQTLRPAVGAQLLGGVFAGDARDLWTGGFGVSVNGTWSLHRDLDLRADVGGIWFDGADGSVGDVVSAPQWGQEAGDIAEGLRVIPVTLTLIHRFERWSNGRFWIPYAGLGAGFYDGVARYTAHDAPGSGETDVERDASVFRPGAHARAGVRFERTSGVFVTVESSVHAVDTRREWSTYFDLGVGVGTYFSSR